MTIVRLSAVRFVFSASCHVSSNTWDDPNRTSSITRRPFFSVGLPILCPTRIRIRISYSKKQKFVLLPIFLVGKDAKLHAVDNLLLYLVKEGNKCPKKMDE